MNPTLNWIAAGQASLLHAAAMLATGHRLVDTDLAGQLAPIVAQTDARLHRHNVNRQEFWASVVPCSAGLISASSGEIAANLADQLRRIDDRTSKNELLLRSGPLRDAWEARGPGLWRSLHHFAREARSSPNVSVILVRPVLGGGGTSYSRAAAISFEALLANPHRELPEVMRLAWLVAQTSFAPACYDRALLPVVLAAAEDVELARCDLATLRLAVQAWHIAGGDDPNALADKLWAWWELFRSGSLRLRDALGDWPT